MLTIQMDMLQTAALAMLLFLLGRFIVNHVDFLKRCCIPAPVAFDIVIIGGNDQLTNDTLKLCQILRPAKLLH